MSLMAAFLTKIVSATGAVPDAIVEPVWARAGADNAAAKGLRDAGLNAWTPPPLNHQMNGRRAATFPSFVVQQEPFFGARALLADGWDARGESFDRIVMEMRLPRHVLLVAGALLLLPVAAAVGHAAPKSPGVEEAILVAEIVLLVLVGRLLGELMLRIGQPSIIGQLLAGVVL